MLKNSLLPDVTSSTYDNWYRTPDITKFQPDFGQLSIQTIMVHLGPCKEKRFNLILVFHAESHCVGIPILNQEKGPFITYYEYEKPCKIVCNHEPLQIS